MQQLEEQATSPFRASFHQVYPVEDLVALLVSDAQSTTLCMVREGHMVGNHTMSHIDFWAHDDAYNRQEIIGEDRVLRAADNYASRLFRIPTGNPENNTLALLQA
ncbi:MAG: polysaccharide deacetylase family protein, partial [Arthrobacter sp.]